MPKSEVYNCDCMTFMQGLKDNAFDLCIADPPYGIGATTMNLGTGARTTLGSMKTRKRNYELRTIHTA